MSVEFVICEAMSAHKEAICAILAESQLSTHAVLAAGPR